MSANQYASPTTADPRVCPECGAPIRLSDELCWLCLRRSTRGSRQNQGGIGTVLAFAFLLAMIGPACSVAFFVVCISTGESRGPLPEPTGGGLVYSTIAALFVFAMLVAALVSLYKRL